MQISLITVAYGHGNLHYLHYIGMSATSPSKEIPTDIMSGRVPYQAAIASNSNSHLQSSYASQVAEIHLSSQIGGLRLTVSAT